jgi:hypothetical protein
LKNSITIFAGWKLSGCASPTHWFPVTIDGVLDSRIHPRRGVRSKDSRLAPQIDFPINIRFGSVGIQNSEHAQENHSCSQHERILDEDG